MFKSLFVLLFIALGFSEFEPSICLPQESSLILSDGPPRILEKYPRVISASVGGSVKLACPLERSTKNLDSSEFIETIIVWQKNEKVIGLGWERFRVKDDLLTIRDVENTDSGNYTCKATNGFGSVVGYYLLCVTANEMNPSERIYLPSPDFCSSNEITNQKNNKDPESDFPKFAEEVLLDTVVEEGEVATLTCQVQSSSSLRVQWFRKLGIELLSWRKRSEMSLKQLNLPRAVNSSSLFQQADSYQSLHGPDFMIATKQNQPNVYASRLTLRRSTPKDTGVYFCFASNSRGFDYKFASLKVIPHDPDGSFLAASNSNVSWVAAFVVCILSLVILVLVILLVRRCKTIKEHKCRTQPQPQTSHQLAPKPQNFAVTMKPPADGARSVEFYPPRGMEYNQMDQVEPFLNMRQHPLYHDVAGPPTNSQIFHPMQLPFLPSTTSSDKTISSYQSLHPEERCNPHYHHNNRNPPPNPLQWSHAPQNFC